MTSRPAQISASLLNADFAHLGDEVRRAVEAGVDSIHLDVMDGHFVENLTIGPVVVQAVRPIASVPYHAHLMVSQPLRHARAFGDHVEERLDRLGDAIHVVAVLLVGIGIVGRDARDLAQVLVVVLGEPQVVALRRRRELRRHEERHEPVLRQLELVHDLRPQQREGIREGGEPEPGTQLLGDGSSADHLALLQDQGAQAATGQVGAVDQPVVATADDDRVVGLAHAVFRSGLKNGSRTTCAATFS